MWSRSRRRATSVVALVLAGGTLASCANGTSTIQGRSGEPLLASSPGQRTVRLIVLADANGENNGFNFNGASSGSMTVSVPRGWRVEVTCINYSTTLTHSCAIVRPGSQQPAFAGASTPNPIGGLRPARSAAFSFVASRTGRYQIVCLVPAHRDQGMWDRFVVTAAGKPSITGANAAVSIA